MGVRLLVVGVVVGVAGGGCRESTDEVDPATDAICATVVACEDADEQFFTPCADVANALGDATRLACAACVGEATCGALEDCGPVCPGVHLDPRARLDVATVACDALHACDSTVSYLCAIDLANSNRPDEVLAACEMCARNASCAAQVFDDACVAACGPGA